MTDHVELVARSIARATLGSVLGNDADRYWRDYAAQARAAVTAMKDIPPEMINVPWGFGVADWNQTIDALLDTDEGRAK